MENTPHKPIYLDPNNIRPLPKSMQGVACSVCNKTQAVWERTRVRTDQQGDPTCSLCWLYESKWGKDNGDQIGKLVSAVEDKLGRLFKKRDNAQLARCRDADRIMSAIVTTTRLFMAKKL